MAAGRPPFIVTNIAEACAKHLHDPPPRLRDLVPGTPRVLDELVDALLAKEPGDRPATREIERRFAALRDPEGGREAIGLATTAATTSRRPGRRPKPVWIAGGAVAAAGLAVAAFTLAHRSEPASPPAVAPVHDAAIVAVTPPVMDASIAAAEVRADAATAVAAPVPVAAASRPHAPARPPVDAAAAVPVKEGTIDAEAVFHVVAGSDRVQRCYLDAVKKQPTLGGKLIAKATIGADGRAHDATAIGVSSEVSRCIATVLASLTFPPAVGGPVEVNIPMSFEPPDPQAVASGRTLETHSFGGTDMPTAVEIADGTRALAAAAAPCADGWHGSAHLQLEIAPDGHVKQAVALGSVAGTQAGTCIEKTATTKGHFASSKSGTVTTVVIDL
jgi:hypothetical protein